MFVLVCSFRCLWSHKWVRSWPWPVYRHGQSHEKNINPDPWRRWGWIQCFVWLNVMWSYIFPLQLFSTFYCTFRIKADWRHEVSPKSTDPVHLYSLLPAECKHSASGLSRSTVFTFCRDLYRLYKWTGSVDLGDTLWLKTNG